MHLSHLVSPKWQLQVGAGVLDVLLSACVADDVRTMAVGRGREMHGLVQDVQRLVQDVHRLVQDVQRLGLVLDVQRRVTAVDGLMHAATVHRLVQDVQRSVTAVDGLMHAATESVLRGKLLHLGKKIPATRVAFEKIRGQMKTSPS